MAAGCAQNNNRKNTANSGSSLPEFNRGVYSIFWTSHPFVLSRKALYGHPPVVPTPLCSACAAGHRAEIVLSAAESTEGNDWTEPTFGAGLKRLHKEGLPLLPCALP